MRRLPQLDGIELREGESPVIVYAPHGARRQRGVRRSDSVNDLHTADLALELAQRLGAYALINRGIDRNDADLNRVSVLAHDASGVLSALTEMIQGVARPNVVPLVLLVHGWNVTLPACDVGIGLVEGDSGLAGKYATVSRATLDGFVGSLIRELETGGIEAPIGRRYPAAGRDNATQLFSGRHCGHACAEADALSTLARAGGVDAVQLELAIPLRWHGSYRDRFLDAVTLAVREHLSARAGGAGAPVPRSEWRLSTEEAQSQSPLPRGWSLQAVLDDGAGLFAGAEPTSARGAAARLCIVQRDGRMLLFVGEGLWSGDENRHIVGGFELKAEARAKAYRGRRVQVLYRGPMVVYPSHDAFCDLEEGLAGAELTEAEAEMELEVDDQNVGVLKGYVRTDKGLLQLECAAMCERGSRRGGNAAAHSRVIVANADPGFAAAVAEQYEVLDWRTDAAGEIRDFALQLADGRPATARVLTRVPVYRMIRKELVVKLTFGTAAVAAATASAADAEEKLALFERIEIVSS